MTYVLAYVSGNLTKVITTPNSDSITGKLIINCFTDSFRHNGIQVVLSGHVEFYSEQSSYCNGRVHTHVYVFNDCPPAAIVSSGGELVQGLNWFDFNVILPPSKSHPIPFKTANGSLTYRLCAFIKRDDVWHLLDVSVVNFKGYYNVLHMELNPFVDSKIIRTEMGGVISTFRVPTTKAIMGQCDRLQATLKLEGLYKGEVSATLKFLRNTTVSPKNSPYHKNIRTEEVILSQNRRTIIHPRNTILEWTIAVPMMKQISYSNELVPEYSVCYYLKCEVLLVPISKAVVNGPVEVIIGTSGATNPNNTACQTGTWDSVTSLMSMLSIPPSRSGLMRSPERSERVSASGAASQSNAAHPTGRRNSVASLLSTFSLPPTYSLLSSRSGSIETLPPQYDELQNE